MVRTMITFTTSRNWTQRRTVLIIGMQWIWMWSIGFLTTSAMILISQQQQQPPYVALAWTTMALPNQRRSLSRLQLSSETAPAVIAAATVTATLTATAATDAVVNIDTDAHLLPSYPIERLPVRIGHGFDIHRMAPIEEAKQPIVIGGIIVPHKPLQWRDVYGKYVTAGDFYESELGIVAHSDGDVIFHSVVDAIFGALTLPDIGQFFPDTDPRWKGCDSGKFMEHAYLVMRSYGYRIGNIDVTLILERPKVANLKPAMKDNIVRLLHTAPGRVNIKARTHEQVDSIGELRSVSCHVVLTLELDSDTIASSSNSNNNTTKTDEA